MQPTVRSMVKFNRGNIALSCCGEIGYRSFRRPLNSVRALASAAQRSPQVKLVIVRGSVAPCLRSERWCLCPTVVRSVSRGTIFAGSCRTLPPAERSRVCVPTKSDHSQQGERRDVAATEIGRKTAYHELREKKRSGGADASTDAHRRRGLEQDRSHRSRPGAQRQPRITRIRANRKRALTTDQTDRARDCRQGG